MFALVACGSTSPPEPSADTTTAFPWPGESWQVSTPEQEDLDARAIAQLDEEFRSGKHGYVDPMHHLLGHSITYRIAVGPQQGRKVFTLQTLPDCGSDDPCARTPGNVAGFSLHAGVATKAHERDKLERLCRYIARPAVSTQRLSLTRNGQVRYELKTPYANGTTHILFEPLDFIAKLVALVPRPRVNLTRYHGVFARHSQYRARVTPAQRGDKKSGTQLGISVPLNLRFC
jgi:hypothetical protein